MKHDIKVGDVWKYRNNDGRLRFPTAKVLFIGDEAVFFKLTTHYGDQHEKITDIDLFIRSYALIERNGKPVIKVPQGEELVGMLCGLSETSIYRAKENASSFDCISVVGSFVGGVYVSRSGIAWQYAYPVDTSKIKQWIPDSE